MTSPSAAAGSDFFTRWSALGLERSDDAWMIGEQPIMYAWERPLMAAFACELCAPDRDLLEIGFGMGVFAAEAQRIGVRRHTIVEPHPEVASSARDLARRHQDVEVVEDYWQRATDRLGTYDAIFYDSFSPDETVLEDLGSFFALAAARLLRPGGCLAFWVPHRTLSEPMQSLVLEHFDSLTLAPVRGLEPTPECRARGFGSTMLVPVARRPSLRRAS